MATAQDKCGGCKVMDSVGGLVERLVASEISAFMRGVEVGKQIAFQSATEYGRTMPPATAKMPDLPPDDEDVVIVGTNGIVGQMGPPR